jgi:hypothetical protein
MERHHNLCIRISFGSRHLQSEEDKQLKEDLEMCVERLTVCSTDAIFASTWYPVRRRDHMFPLSVFACWLINRH